MLQKLNLETDISNHFRYNRYIIFLLCLKTEHTNVIQFPPPIKTYLHDIIEILFKVALNTITLILTVDHLTTGHIYHLWWYFRCFTVPLLFKILVKVWTLSLWKESLNIDCQQFHQYQQSKQSPLISNHWT